MNGGGRAIVPAAVVLSVLLSVGCSRLPKIIVLHDPLTAREHLELGVAYERGGELDLALREYDRALSKDPRLIQAWINSGNVCVTRRDFREARRRYLAALDLVPGHPEATNNLAWAAMGSKEAGDLGEAEERLEAVLRDPRNRTAPLLDTLGVLKIRLSKPREAEEAFSEAERACGPACSEPQRQEIAEHRRELRSRFPAALVPALLK